MGYMVIHRNKRNHQKCSELVDVIVQVCGVLFPGSPISSRDQIHSHRVIMLVGNREKRKKIEDVVQ